MRGLSHASIEATLNVALLQHQRGQLALAEALYDQVLLLDPANTDALHLKGMLALAQGSSLEALELTERACALLPRSALFQRSRAEVLGALSRWSDAKATLDTVIALKPDWAEAHAAMGVAHAASGDSASAKASLARATSLDPQLAEAWSNLGVMHLADKETTAAVTAFESALKARPGFVDSLNGLGVAFTEAGRLDDAIAAFDQVLANAPGNSLSRVDALTNRAVALQILGRWAAALNDLTSASALAPSRAAIWRNMAKSLAALGRLDEADAACTRALVFEPGDATARYERAFVRLLAGDIANGFDDYRARPTVDRARYALPTALLPTDLSGRKFRLVIEQ
ncbi:MAG: tetratricopeptide repeat protein, partial [Hyphomicrobium sp.]